MGHSEIRFESFLTIEPPGDSFDISNLELDACVGCVFPISNKIYITEIFQSKIFFDKRK
jgi:hypothetical protein